MSTATVNFASDRANAGTHSNFSPELSARKMRAVEVEAVNIRALPEAPSIDRQGFALAHHPIDGNWADRAWLNDIYVPSCLALVERLTGAKTAMQMYYPITRTSVATEGKAGAAGFIHLDQPREEYAAQAREKAAESGRTMGRAAIFNVWKAISPPPQDRPLALCDRRDISPEDHVRGVTVEEGIAAPYIALAAPAKTLSMYYAPDMTLDESIVFLSADFDPANPLGCPHSAIAAPGDQVALKPRTSVEVRVLALFD